eukprot:7319880-Pyramimonas_sp.AAC.3
MVAILRDRHLLGYQLSADVCPSSGVSSTRLVPRHSQLYTTGRAYAAGGPGAAVIGGIGAPAMSPLSTTEI